MTITAVLLGYAAVLAIAGPRLLSGRWLSRSPRLALALWHATALSVLSAVGLATIACFAADGMLLSWLDTLAGRAGSKGALTGWATLAVPGLLIARLTWAVTHVVLRRRADRRRHLEFLTLLGRHDADLDATVVPADTPAAYCVPGTRRIVLTRGALAVLDDAELRAVLAHERAHLAGRHHVVVAWAGILRHAFPAVPFFRAVHQATAQLVELLADDQTRRAEPSRSLATAIEALSCGRTPAVSLPASGGSVLGRVERLLAPPPPLPVATRIGAAGAALSIATLPMLIALTPALLAAGLVACPHLLG